MHCRSHPGGLVLNRALSVWSTPNTNDLFAAKETLFLQADVVKHGLMYFNTLSFHTQHLYYNLKKDNITYPDQCTLDTENCHNNTNIQVKHQGECKSGPVLDCQDLNEQCAAWASQGECNINPSYMVHNCQKSCNLCGVDDLNALIPAAVPTCSGSCTDQNQHCQNWASVGECQSNPGYMNQFCKKSCGVC